MNYHGNAPYSTFREYRTKYARGYHGKAQRNIGIRNDRNKNQVKAVDRRPGNDKAQMKRKDGKDQRIEKNKKDDRGDENGNRR